MSSPHARPPMTADEIREAETLLDQGWSYHAVGCALGRNHKTVRKHLPGWCPPPPIVHRHDERIVELTRAGWTAQQIADALRITSRTVARARVRRGVAKPPTPPLTDDEIQRAELLLDDGASCAEVARTLGRCPGAIRKRFPGRGGKPGAGVEWRRMMAALDAIPPNVVTLRRTYLDPSAVSVVDRPFRRTFAEVVS